MSALESHPRAAALIEVECRLDDLGLEEIARCLGRTPGDQIHRVRGYLIEVRIAANAIHRSACHFDHKPIAACAVSLSEAVTRALLLVDQEIDALYEANRNGPANIAAARMPLKTPRRLVRDGES